VQRVRELGGAELGDKTMVDAMVPFDDALRAALSGGAAPPAALAVAATAARDAAAATAQLRPRRGRARPLAERSVGHADPGAVSFSLIVTACAAELAR
jgi:dihydroxyacetone kinase